MDTKERTYWCWAAVAQSVRTHFNPNAPLTQCQVATGTLNRYLQSEFDCCHDPGSCDFPYYLDLALTQIGHLNVVHTAPLSWNDTLRVIHNAHRPICAYLAAASSGHYVVITDAFVRNGTEYLLVCDPDDMSLGPDQVTYDELLWNYQGTGYQWFACFFVKP